MSEAAGVGVRPEVFAPDLSVRWLASGGGSGTCHRRVDGALLFLDISGFTALSEALADLGRVGSEEVRDVINATFTAILELAYAQGGSLLKFGGDAVLLLFEGHGAGVRAAAAARGMLDRLLARNPVRTTGGNVTLGATVGVHEGPVDLYLLGTRHRELLVLGPTATETIRIESSADRDEVLVSDAVARRLDAGLLGAQRDGSRVLLGTPGAHAPPGYVEGPHTEHDAWQLVPEGLRPALREGRLDGQHRRATVAFVKIAGTDELLAASGPEALGAELATVVDAAQEACARYAVTWLSSDVDENGCKLILVAGVPSGDDDDDDRVVHAASVVAGSSERLRVRVGVHRGPLFSGVVGPHYRLTYTVLGDAVNLAARTMGKAEAGQVLATIGVLNGLRTLHDITRLEPFHVKGKTQPVRAGIVGAEIGVRVRQRADDTAFVGRRDELHRLVDHVDAVAHEGVGRAVCIAGPAGIGKSRLLDELQEARPTVVTQLVACTRFSVDRPYRTIAMLLRLVLTGERHGPGEDVIAAARALLSGTEDERFLPLLGPVYDVEVAHTDQTRDLDPANVAARMRDLIGRLLLLGLPRHATLVFEDVQWMDPESAAMVQDAVTRLLPRRSWLMVTTTRSEAEFPDGSELLELGPLSTDESMTLALLLVDDGIVPFELAPQLVVRSAGNPLFLTELARAAASGEMPDDVESLVRQRLDALGARQLRLVQCAAVLGIEFPPVLLDALLEGDERVGGLTPADVPDVLDVMRSGYLRFRQAMYQEAAYEAMPHRERTALHLRAAEALGRLEDDGTPIAVEARSRHHHLAGDRRGSWTWSRAALDAAIARSAPRTAIGFARRALEAASRLRIDRAERAAVWERLGDALEATGAYDDAREAYRRARRLVRPSPVLARKQGHIRERQGEYAQAMRWYGIALDEVGNQLEERMTIQMRRAITLVRTARAEAAYAQAERTLAVAELRGDDQLLGYLHYVLAWSGQLLNTADHADHLRRAERAFSAAGDLKGQVLVLNEIGVNAREHGRWDEAEQAYRRNLELLDRLGDVAHAAGTSVNLGLLLTDKGAVVEAVDLLRHALRRLEIAGHVHGAMVARWGLGRALGHVGEYEEADRLLEAATADAFDHGVADLAQAACAQRAEVAVFAGATDAARRHLGAAEAIELREGSLENDLFTFRLRGVLAALDGDDLVASRYLDRATGIALTVDSPYDLALIDAARACLLGDEEAGARAEAALRQLGAVRPGWEMVLGEELARTVARPGLMRVAP